MKTAIIAGSTGLIGSQLLQLLLQSDQYSKIVAITRQDLEVHPKLVQIKADFEKAHSVAAEVVADDVFCCLGTTMAKAKSKENFYQVDFFYPFLLAKTSQAHGAKKFMLVSALGANKNASVYYNQVKGQVEEAIQGVGFPTLHIFRPSLLLGARKESRAGEDAAKFVYKYFGFLIPKRLKAIESIKVARAMIHFAAQPQTGVFIHESEELQQF